MKDCFRQMRCLFQLSKTIWVHSIMIKDEFATVDVASVLPYRVTNIFSHTISSEIFNKLIPVRLFKLVVLHYLGGEMTTPGGDCPATIGRRIGVVDIEANFSILKGNVAIDNLEHFHKDITTIELIHDFPLCFSKTLSLSCCTTFLNSGNHGFGHFPVCPVNFFNSTWRTKIGWLFPLLDSVSRFLEQVIKNLIGSFSIPVLKSLPNGFVVFRSACERTAFPGIKFNGIFHRIAAIFQE
mmetsp:Transcript_4653/g.7054  ORF Transcript_4653/g.7054 Transcript_4653/m.7054 type:complete len:239 (+) Transcript_4653:177-893(+)